MIKIQRYFFLIIILILSSGCTSVADKGNNGVKLEISKQKEERTIPLQAVLSSKKITLDTVYFEFDSFKLSKEAKEILDDNTSAFKKAKEIIIIGGCDSRGTEKHNKALAQKRAQEVANFYIDKGVAANLITAYANLTDKEICLNNDEVCHSKNRKAKTIVVLQ